MADKAEVGYVLTCSFFVDQDTQQQVQITCNAPIDSSAEELGAKLAVMRKAAWMERIAANDRILARGEAIKEARNKRIAESLDKGDDVDDEEIAEETARINATLVKVRAEADADKAVAG